MIPTLVESPFSAPVASTRALYRHYLDQALLDCLARGEAPFASHRLYTQVLDDGVAVERQQGIEAGLAWGDLAARSVFYVDLGISRGMRLGLERAVSSGWTILFRSLAGWAPDACPANLRYEDAKRYGEALPLDRWFPKR